MHVLVLSEIVTFVKCAKRMNELFCMCISYLCLVNMHNYHAMYVYLYTIREYELNNLYFGMKNIHCVLLLCITDVYYYYKNFINRLEV